MSKFGRVLNQLLLGYVSLWFLVIIYEFLEFLVIFSLMLDVNFENWIFHFSETDFALFIYFTQIFFKTKNFFFIFPTF